MARNAVALASAILLVAACTTSNPAASGGASAPASGGASAPASAGAGGSPAAGGTIKIGGGFALTGEEASLDVPAANGAKLAVKQINAARGVNGSQIDFILHHNQYIATVAAQTAKQVLEHDKVPGMIG